MRRPAARLALAAIAVGLLAAAGCAADIPESRDGAFNGRVDGGVPPPEVDGGMGADASVDGGASAADEFFTGGNPAACYDDIDNNRSAGADCQDPSCQVLPSCCVQRSYDGCCLPTGGAIEIADLSGCDGRPADECEALLGAGFSPFGLPAPSIEGAHFLPNGDHSYDSGALSSATLDPVHEVLRLYAVLGVGPGGCGAGCLDSIAFGVTEQEELGDGSEVRPLVAVAENGVRGQLTLLVHGFVARTFPLPDREDHHYQLVLHPEGLIDLFFDLGGGALAPLAKDVPYQPSEALRAVVYGRSENRSALLEGARLRSLDVVRERCNMPAAREPGGQVLPRMGATWASEAPRVGEPSVALTPEGSARMLFSMDDRIFLAREMAGAFELAGGSLSPVLDASAPFGGGVSDPALLARPEGGYLAFFTAREEGGAPRIGRAVASGAEPDAFSEQAFVELDFPEGLGLDELSQPSALFIGGLEAASADARYSTWDLSPGDLIVAARAMLGGVPAIVLLRSDDGGATLHAMQLDNGDFAVIRPRLQSLTAFDHDDVASPELVYINGAYHLFYAGRRGTRWSIGLFVSDDLRSFRSVLDGAPLLGGSGDGFDALGARSPSALVRDDQIELYYVGTDGARERVGVSRSALP